MCCERNSERTSVLQTPNPGDALQPKGSILLGARSEHHVYDAEHEIHKLMQEAQEVGQGGTTQRSRMSGRQSVQNRELGQGLQC